MHALTFVSISITSESPSKNRIRGILDIDHVQPPRKSVGTHSVGESRSLINGNGMRPVESSIAGSRVEYHRHAQSIDIQKPRQIEHLHPRQGGLAHNEGMVGVRPDIPPLGIHQTVSRKDADVDGIHRIGDLNERHAGVETHFTKETAPRRMAHPPPSVLRDGPIGREGGPAHARSLHLGVGIDLASTLPGRELAATVRAA